VSQPSQRSAVLRRLLRAVPIAIVVVAVTVLFFAPSAEGRVRPPAVPDPGTWPMVSLVGLFVLATVVPASVVVLVLRRRY